MGSTCAKMGESLLVRRVGWYCRCSTDMIFRQAGADLLLKYHFFRACLSEYHGADSSFSRSQPIV